MVGKSKELSDGYHDLSKDFIKVEEEPLTDIKFYSVNEEMSIKEILSGIKSGNEILFINLKEIIENPGALRIFVNKIRRVSDEYSITMKLYGKTWLLILPNNVTFHVGEE